CLGLPPKEPGVGSFSGHGDLPVVSGSLTWSYGYAGERFQVIVLNSRTRRTFATDKSFPGLLSDAAIAGQLNSTAAAVSIVIAPAPVLGFHLVEEYLQRWSTKSYKFDPEA